VLSDSVIAIQKQQQYGVFAADSKGENKHRH